MKAGIKERGRQSKERGKTKQETRRRRSLLGDAGDGKYAGGRNKGESCSSADEERRRGLKRTRGLDRQDSEGLGLRARVAVAGLHPVVYEATSRDLICQFDQDLSKINHVLLFILSPALLPDSISSLPCIYAYNPLGLALGFQLNSSSSFRGVPPPTTTTWSFPPPLSFPNCTATSSNDDHQMVKDAKTR